MSSPLRDFAPLQPTNNAKRFRTNNLTDALATPRARCGQRDSSPVSGIWYIRIPSTFAHMLLSTPQRVFRAQMAQLSDITLGRFREEIANLAAAHHIRIYSVPAFTDVTNWQGYVNPADIFSTPPPAHTYDDSSEFEAVVCAKDIIEEEAGAESEVSISN